MGFFSSVKKIAKKAFKVAAPIALTAAAGTALPGGPAAAIAPQFAGILRGLPGVLGRAPLPLPGRGPPIIPPRVPPIRGRFPGGLIGGAVGGALATIGPMGVAGACPAGFHPAKDGSGRCVRNRRMNPMNPRAARRAIRRIKAARKMLQQIERQLPKQRVRARVPGHRARLQHE